MANRVAKIRSVTLSDEEVNGLYELGKELLASGEQVSYTLTGVIRWVALNGKHRLVPKESDGDDRLDALEKRLKKVEEIVGR